MKINVFKENDTQKKVEMDKRMESLKLERIQSLWYFVHTSSKSTVVGSKS